MNPFLPIQINSSSLPLVFLPRKPTSKISLSFSISKKSSQIKKKIIGIVNALEPNPEIEHTVNQNQNMAPLTTDELNYMIFRYLNESGFQHSAFTFGYEARMNNSPIDGNLVPPQALITFVQKGIQYIEIEAMTEMEAMTDDAVNEDISLVQPLELIKYSADELYQIVTERKKNRQTTPGVKGLGGEASTRVQDRGKAKVTQPGSNKDKGKATQTQPQPGNVKSGGKALGLGLGLDLSLGLGLGLGGGATTPARVEDKGRGKQQKTQPGNVKAGGKGMGGASTRVEDKGRGKQTQPGSDKTVFKRPRDYNK